MHLFDVFRDGAYCSDGEGLVDDETGDGAQDAGDEFGVEAGGFELGRDGFGCLGLCMREVVSRVCVCVRLCQESGSVRACTYLHVQGLGVFTLQKIKDLAQGQRTHEQAVVYQETMSAIE